MEKDLHPPTILVILPGSCKDVAANFVSVFSPNCMFSLIILVIYKMSQGRPIHSLTILRADNVALLMRRVAM